MTKNPVCHVSQKGKQRGRGMIKTVTNGAKIATKADLRETELRLIGEITRVNGEMALLKWMIGFTDRKSVV